MTSLLPCMSYLTGWAKEIALSSKTDETSMPRRRNAWDWYLFYKDNGGLTLKPAVVFVSECIISQQ